MSRRQLQTAARVFALLATLVVSCGGNPTPSNYPTQQYHVEDTTLGPGDLFEVRIYNEAEMSSDYYVSSQGTIQFPHIGTVAVSGKTPEQVEDEIGKRLADGYLVNPQVSILVKEINSRKVSVFGQVRKPGTLSFRDGMTIVEAVSQAGGFTGMAKANAVTVTRKEADAGKEVKYTVPVEAIGKGSAANFYMRPGDVIFVPERWY